MEVNYVKITIADDYYSEEIRANLEEVRLITGKDYQEILHESVKNTYEWYRKLNKEGEL